MAPRPRARCACFSTSTRRRRRPRSRQTPSTRCAALLPELDFVLTYGGGPPVTRRYRELGARECHAIYNALDPETHHPVPPEPRFEATLGFLANRLPDREARVEAFFLDAARRLPEGRFLLGGNGWDDKAVPGNVAPARPCADARPQRFQRDAARRSERRQGQHGAGRLLAGDAGLRGGGGGRLPDHRRLGGDRAVPEPDEEILVARDGAEVAEHLHALTRERAAEIGRRALARVLAEHTYDRRAEQVERLLLPALSGRPDVIGAVA